ncbi:unnamed protein product [Dicrocoelium dendriticum]|nr:unnamed protein product [Dicrocoelium dendriticum]
MPCLKVRCCTWNVGDEGPPPDDLHHLLGLGNSDTPEIVALGLQEIVDPDDWKKRLIEHLHPAGYVLVKARNCWAIWMLVFVRRNLLSAITNIESEVTPSGYVGVMGNKGGVSVRFEICGVNVVFLSCHFAAHAENTRDRLNDYLDIITHQTFRDEDVHSILDHDYVFWMGDLNFRLEGLDKPTVERCVQENRFAELLSNDQLCINKRRKLIFEDFKEGEINFPPTFKFDKGTDRYDSSSKQRVPAWTDRILYMAHRDFATDYYASVYGDASTARTSRRVPIRGAPSEADRIPPISRRASLGPYQPEIQLLQYTSLSEYKSSDHRPVVGTFTFAVPSRWFSLPISFVEPQVKELRYGTDLEFLCTLMDPPAVLHMEDTDIILSTKPSIPTLGFIQLMLMSALGRPSTHSPEQDRTPAAPHALEKGSRDWIGVYPADFVDLENGYTTYVYAPKCATSVAQEVHAATVDKPAFPCFKGKIPARQLAQLINQRVQLVYWSERKNCPQGYSQVILIKS